MSTLRNRDPRPVLGRRCPARLEMRPVPSFEEALERLRADIRAHGGLEAWLDTRIEAWLTPGS